MLFKRDSLGSIRTWDVEVFGAMYRTIAGLKDGTKVLSDWTLCVGKNVGRANSTTPEQQALFEAASLRTRKLGQGGYFTDEADVDKPIYFEPMLAKQYSDFKDKLKFPVLVQPKLDGIRCIARMEGLFSRQGKPILAVPHVMEAVRPFFEAHPDAILDGELYNHDLKADFNTIVSAVKKAKPDEYDFARSAALVQYHIYDYFNPDWPGETFINRESFLLHGDAFGNGVVYLVDTRLAVDAEHLDQIYAEFLEDGYEGQIIRLDTPYENKRSSGLLKRKEFLDQEFEILDIEEGLGNWSGCAKTVIISLGIGKTGRAGIRGTQEMMRDLLARKAEVIGSECTVRFQNWTPDGYPRFPVVTAIHEGKRSL